MIKKKEAGRADDVRVTASLIGVRLRIVKRYTTASELEIIAICLAWSLRKSPAGLLTLLAPRADSTVMECSWGMTGLDDTHITKELFMERLA